MATAQPSFPWFTSGTNPDPPPMVNNILELDPSVPQDRRSVHAPAWPDPGRAGPGQLNGHITFNIWNHIIPYNLLRDVWNGLVAIHITDQIPEASVVLHRYLALLDPRLGNALNGLGTTVDEVIKEMRVQNPQTRSAPQQPSSGQNPSTRSTRKYPGLQGLTIAQRHQLWTTATWPAWNIFAGPHGIQRWDDPGGDNMERLTGLDRHGQRRMQAITTLNQPLEDFRDASRIRRGANDFRPAVTADHLLQLSNAVQVARQNLVSFGDRPLPFDPNMWRQEERHGQVRWVQRP